MIVTDTIDTYWGGGVILRTFCGAFKRCFGVGLHSTQHWKCRKKQCKMCNLICSMINREYLMKCQT